MIEVERCNGNRSLKYTWPINQQVIKVRDFFVPFIDNFSKLTVIYCIKHKSDLYECFVEYCMTMQNITGKKIKQLCCGNGLEYINKNFYSFVRQQGVALLTHT